MIYKDIPNFTQMKSLNVLNVKRYFRGNHLISHSHSHTKEQRFVCSNIDESLIRNFLLGQKCGVICINKTLP